MTTVEALWQQLEQEPENTTLKLVLADALMDADEEEEADTIRWAVRNKRWPTNRVTLNSGNFYWVRFEGKGSCRQSRPWFLPDAIWNETGSCIGVNMELTTARKSLSLLQNALIKLGIVAARTRL